MVKNPNVPSLIQILGFSLQPPVALVPRFSVTPSSCNEQFFCHSIKLLIPTEMCGLPNKAQIQATSSSENKHLFDALQHPSRQSPTPYKIEMHFRFQLNRIHFGNQLRLKGERTCICCQSLRILCMNFFLP